MGECVTAKQVSLGEVILVRKSYVTYFSAAPVQSPLIKTERR